MTYKMPRLSLNDPRFKKEIEEFVTSIVNDLLDEDSPSKHKKKKPKSKPKKGLKNDKIIKI